jgi:hypothetical protein
VGTAMLVGVALAGLAGLAGCGGGEPALSDDAARLLQSMVGDARQSASDGDVDAALAQLADASNALVRLNQDNQVTDERAAEITEAINETQTALQSSATTTSTSAPETTEAPTTEAPTTEPPTTASTTTTSTPPTSETTDPDEGDGGGDGNGGGNGGGNGNGNGRGNGEGN